MADQVTGDIAQSSEDASVETGSDNMSVLDAVGARIKQLDSENASQPDPETDENAETEGEEVTPEGKAKEAESTTDEVANNLEDLSDEEKQYLEDNPESRLAKRIATLTRKRKEAEEALQKSLDKQQQEPEETPEPVVDNPFKELDTIDSVQEKKRELIDLREWMGDLLEDHEDDLSDDVIYEEGEASFTKAEVRKRLRALRKEIDTFIPARKAEIKSEANRASATTFFDEQAKTDLAWMGDEDSEEFKAYSNVLGDKTFQKDMEAIRVNAPEIATRMNWILAHFTNSLVGGAKSGKSNPIKPTTKLPTTPNATAAAPGRSKSGAGKKLAELQARYEASGRPEDGIAVRTFQLQNQL